MSIKFNNLCEYNKGGVTSNVTFKNQRGGIVSCITYEHQESSKLKF